MWTALAEDSSGRDIIHILVGFTAIFLKYLSRVEAFFVVVFVFFLVYLLAISSGSRFFNIVARSDDWKRGYARGPLFYGLSIIFLVLFFPLYIVAACIAIMGFGDGFATVVGKRFGKTPMSWAKGEKTLEGMVAFFMFASVSSFLLLGFLLGEFTGRIFFYAVISSFVGALVEMLDISVDDNLSVPIASAVVLYVLTLVSVVKLWAIDLSLLFEYGVIILLLGYPTLKFKVLDGKGSLAAFILGLVVYVSLGFSGFMVLLSLHIIGAVTTRIGIKDKMERKVEQEKIRSIDNILANGLVPVIGAFLYLAATTNNNLFYVGFVGAISAATSDTTSSEIGQLSSKKPHLITTWEEVEAGTDGALTLLGNLSALLSALVVAAIALIFSIPGIRQIPLVVSLLAGGFVGTTVDSFFGATLEQSEIIGNNTVNLLATASGFLSAIAVYSLL